MTRISPNPGETTLAKFDERKIADELPSNLRSAENQAIPRTWEQKAPYQMVQGIDKIKICGYTENRKGVAGRRPAPKTNYSKK